jgi:hypothetical protein
MTTLSAKEAARELGTDARNFRKFMRAILPEEDRPGQGNRYQIEFKEIKSLKRKFKDWEAPRTKTQSANGKKAKSNGAGPTVDDMESIEEGDEDLALDELDLDDIEVIDD